MSRNQKIDANNKRRGEASVGRKVASVAMSALLVCSLWPANATSAIADEIEDAAAAQAEADAQAQAEAEAAAQAEAEAQAQAEAEAAAQAEAEAQAKAEAEAAAAAEAQAKAEAEAAAAAEAAAQAEKEAAEAAAAEAEANKQVDVSLDLSDAYINYNGQDVTAPATKVTVLARDDFKFTATPNNGFDLEHVKVVVNGVENEIWPDGNGIYTIASSDVAQSPTIKLETVEHKDEEQADESSSADNTAVAISDETVIESETTSEGDTTASDNAQVEVEGETDGAKSDDTAATDDAEKTDEAAKSDAATDAKSDTTKTETESAADSGNWLSNLFGGLFSGSAQTTSLYGTSTVASDGDYTMEIGDTQEITGTSGYSHSWSSSDSSIASVSGSSSSSWSSSTSTGTVTAKAAGTVTITHTYKTSRYSWSSSTQTESWIVTVNDEEPVVIDHLEISGDDTVNVDSTTKLTTNATGHTVTWTSSNESVATVSNGTVTGVKRGNATITATCTVDGVTYTATKDVYVQETGGNTATFVPSITNAEVAYFNWHDSSDTSDVTLYPVSDGSLSVSNFTSSSSAGYIVFFVKPNDNHLLTGLGADGNGDLYVVGSGNYGNIAGYPGLSDVIAAAQAAGYVGMFGYSRQAGTTCTNTAFTVNCQSPDMTISAASNKTTGVSVGETLEFTVTITPQTVGKATVSGVTVNSATVNGKTVEISELSGSTSGVYTGKVSYTVTEADVAAGAVTLNVNASTKYAGTIDVSDGATIGSTSTVTKDASCVCRFADKKDVTYTFKSGTDGKDLPSSVVALLPSDTQSYTPGVTVNAKSVSETMVNVDGGYWTWKGWDRDAKMMTTDGVVFTGTWEFTAYHDVTVYYRDEDGNNIAGASTYSDKIAGDTLDVNAKTIEGYTVKGASAVHVTVDDDDDKNVVVFTYTLDDEAYTVHYYLNGTSSSVQTDKSATGKYKSTVTESPAAIDGYTAVSSGDQSIELGTDASKNVITFYYYKNVTLTANSDTKTYNGSEQSVTGYASSETAAAFDGVTLNGGKGTDAGEYTYSFAEGTAGKVSTDGKYVVSDTTDGKLTINPVAEVKVTITGKTETKTYNGSEQSVTGYDFSADNAAYTQSKVSFTGDATAKGTNAGEYAMGLSQSQFSNSDTKNFTKVTFEVTDGKLTITKANIYKDAVNWNKDDVSYVYDGTAHSAATATATDKYGNALRVQYSVDGENWYDSVSQITATNVSDTKDVKLRATSDNYTDYATNSEKLTITARAVTLVSNTKSWPYDGQAHTDSEVSGWSEDAAARTGFVSGEVSEVKATGSVTNVSEGEVTNSISYKEGAGFKSENYSISKTEGKLSIYANDDKVTVTITENSVTEDYDGTEKSITGYTVTNISNELYTTDNFEFKGTAEAKGTNAGFYEMKVSASDFKNTSANFKDENVTFTIVDGGLTINAKKITDESISVTAPSDVVYNGQVQEQEPVVKDGDKTLVKGKDYTLTYSQDVTNAGTVTVTVTGAGNYTGTITTTYNITKRTVNLKSETASKEYDGTALTMPTVTGQAYDAEAGTGFVEGEVSNVEATGSVTTVADGEKTNTITYTENANFKASNYNINKDEGKLSITASNAEVVVTIAGNTKTVVYDYWGEQSVEGYSVSSIKVDDKASTLYTQNDFKFSGTAKATGKDAGTYNMGMTEDNFSNTNANFANVKFVVNDGSLVINPQSVNPQLADGSDDPAYKKVMVGTLADHYYVGKSQKYWPLVKIMDHSDDLVLDKDYTLSITEDTTNVGIVTVMVTGIGNFCSSITRSYHITAMPLNVETGSATKVYDGTPLTASGKVMGLQCNKDSVYETVGFEATGAQTEVGTSDNTASNLVFAAEGNDYTAKSSNYTMGTTTLGTLTVTAQSINPEDEDAYKGVSVDSPKDVTYDGQTHKWAPTVTSADGKTALTEGEDYTVTYTQGDKTVTDFTNVTGAITVTIAGTGNYTGTVTRTYQITKRLVTLSSESHTFTYNGSAQSWNKYTCSDDLFSSETENMACKATVTKVGDTAENTVTYDWKSGFSANNYEISTEFGTLSVKNTEDEIVVTTTGGTFTYDGQAHGATVTVSDLPDGYTLGNHTSSATATDVTTEDVTATCDTLVITNAEGTDVTKDLKVSYVNGAIKVTPATVTVVTPDATKVFDGSALTSAGTISGIVEGETYKFETTGSQTNVGNSSNSYAITWAAEGNEYTAKQSNYSINETVGTLTVTEKTITDDFIADKASDVVYNGTEQKFVPVVKDGETTLVEGADYTVSYTQGDKTVTDFTNVTGKITVTVTGKGNYTGSVTTSYQILPATLTVSTPNDSKTYDGAALTAAGTISGFVNNETATFTTTGSQTNVGTSVNTYSLVWDGTAKENNYTISENTGVLTVSKANAADGVTLSGNDAVQTYSGSALAAKAATATAKVAGNTWTVEYSADGQNWTTDPSTITATDVADTKTVQVRASSPANYDGYAETTEALTVNVRKVTLTSETKSFTYDGSAHTATTVTESEDGFVQGEVTDLTATGSITNVGSVINTISKRTADSFKAGNYSITENPGTLTVTEKTLTDASVTVSQPEGSVYDGREHKFVPVVTDGTKTLVEGTDYEVTYSTDDFTNVTGTITVTVTGKGNYKDSVTREYQITARPLTVTTDTLSKTYDGTALTGKGKVENFVAGETYTFTVTGSQTAVGSSSDTYTLVFDGTAKEANYAVTSETLGTLTVAESEQEIVVTTTGGEFTYDGQVHGATVSVTNLPAGYYAANAYSNATARLVSDGTVSATADVLVIKNAAGEDVTSKVNIKKVDGSITIKPREVTVTTGSAEKEFDNTELTNDEASISGLATCDNAIVWATGSQTEVGKSDNSYGIYWMGTDTAKNYTVKEELGTLEVKPSTAAVTITGDSDSKTYDGSALTKSTATITGVPSGFGVTVTTAGSQTDAGTSTNHISGYAITDATGKQVTSYFSNITVTDGSLTVNPRAVTIKSGSAEKVFDGTALTSTTATVTSDLGFVDGEVSNIRATGTIINVGETTNTIEYDKADSYKDDNYTVTKTEGTLRVTQKDIADNSITVSDPSDVTYDGAAHQFVPEVTDGKTTLAEGDDYTVTYTQGTDTVTDFTNVTGTITVTVTGAGNYKGSVTKTYQIKPAEYTVTTETASKVYDGTALTAEGAVAGIVEDETYDFATTGTQTAVGSSTNAYELKWTGTAKASNYTKKSESLGTLTVTKQTINPGTDPENPDPSYKGVTIDDPTDSVYNGTENKFVPVVTDANGNALIAGTDYTVAYARGDQSTDDFTDAGTITVTITGQGNYDGTVTKTYTISPATVTVTTPSESKVYDGKALTAEGTIEGIVSDETYDFKTTGTQTAVGSSTNSYSLNWNGTAKAANYSVTESLGTLTVTQYADEIVATASSYNGAYDGQEHAATVNVTVPAGYTVQTAESDAKITDAGEVVSNVDRLVIVNAAGEDVTDQLKVTKNSGKLTVSKLTLTVTTPSDSKVYDGTALTAEGSISGFLEGETATFKTTGSQTAEGSSTNTYSLVFDQNAKQANYNVTESLGTLTVSKQSLNPEDKNYGGVQVSQPEDTTYNGSEQKQPVAVTDKDGNALVEDTDYEISYTAATNAGEVTVTITGKGNYTGTVTRTYAIAPHALHVTTESATKVYDGTALTYNKTSYEGLQGSDSINVAATGSQTAQGSSDNTYTIGWGTTLESNYTVTDTLGTLTVTKQTINPGTDPENPDPSYGGVQINDPSDSVYDGAEHKFVPTVTDKSGNALVAGTDYKVTYSTDDFTNVTGTITVTIEGQGNYTGTVTKTYQITKRDLYVTTESASKVYDGTALTAEGSVNNLVEGEEVSFATTGTITDQGSTDNEYTLSFDKSAKAGNYNVVESIGTLTVTKQTINPGTDPENPDPSYGGVQINDPEDVTYDGQEHKFVPEVTDKDGNPLEEGKDYTVEYNNNDFTDAGTITVTIKGNGNYDGEVVKVYTINKAQYTVETYSATKSYDGEALTADGVVSGIVNGETYGFKTTGSQTTVGTSDNGYELTWTGTAKSANYELKGETIGKLTVTEYADTVVVTTTGYEGVYDGQEHAATVDVTNMPAGYTVEASSSAKATDVTEGDGIDATADKLVIKNTEGKDVTSDLDVQYVNDKIKITPASVTVTTPSAAKVYDGTALVAAGHMTELVNGETATFSTTGSQTEVGSSTNWYEIKWNGTAKQSNYTVDDHDLGTLTVTKQTINPNDPENPDAYKGVNVSQPEDTVYNGTAQDQPVTVTDAQGNALVEGTDYELSYENDVDAGTATVTITGKGNYTGSVTRTYTINPATVTVTTPSASKVFDGTALTAEGSMSAFQNGETATFTTTGSQISVGSSTNTYEIAWNGSAKQANYNVVENLGTLEVKKQSINPEDESYPKDKDGNPAGVKINDPQNPTYDGQEHKFVPEVTDKDGNPLEEGKDYTVEYDTDDFTDTGTITVTIKGEGDYDGEVVKVYTIKPASVTVTTESATKTYDGTELTADGYTVTGVVEGETYGFVTTGTQTAVGESNNTYELTWAADGNEYTAKSSNYELVSETLGKLVVTEFADQVVVTTTGGTFTYDGTAHGATVQVTFGEGLAEEQAGYTVETAESSATATDVTTDPVAATADKLVIKNAEGEDVTDKLEITYVDDIITVTPAALTVTTQGATKTFDGQALTNATMTITGLVTVDGVSETVVARTTGTQTAAGTSKNTYVIDWNDAATTAKQGNYTITEVLGDLVVNAAPAAPVDNTPANNDGDGDGDGVPAAIIPAVVAAPVEAVAEALEDAYEAITGDVVEPEQIYDEENPLGQAAQPHCWVHFWMLVGLVATAVYGIAIMVRRGNHTRKLRNNMNDIIGAGDDPDHDGDSVSSTNPAGMEA